MKKFNKFGYASAMLLATAMGFTGCSSDDEMENINPTYDGSSVKTQFSISLTQKANKGGRMAQEFTGESVFKGMNQMYLYQFTEQPTAASVNLRKNDLGTLTSFNYQNANLNGNYYTTLDFFLGVNNLLFYGVSKADQGNVADKFAAGWTKKVFADEGDAVQVTKFAPEVILATSDATFGNAFDDIAEILTNVYALFAADNLPMAVVQERDNLARMKSASSVNVLALLEDVYNSIESQLAGLPTEAQTATNTLLGKILTTANLSKAGANVGQRTLSWLDGHDPNFPEGWNLPAGAVALNFNAGTFTKVEGTTNIEGMEGSKPSVFAFPAELLYFANSKVGVSSEAYFNGANAAPNDATWTTVQNAFTAYEVAADTRSVILFNPINYGVARLATSVKFANSTVEHNIAIPASDPITVGTENFVFTGLLIGGQKEVDWKFEQNTTADAYTIYDKTHFDTPAYVTTAATPVNYTLAYESKPAVGNSDTEAKVKVAIELKNNSGRDFKGKDGNVIPNGGTFYLVGELKPEVAKIDSNNNLNDAVYTIDRVFKQDYLTTAVFTIGSLKNAYNVIPDLESPKLEFGMSVDLEWKDGLDFEVAIP